MTNEEKAKEIMIHYNYLPNCGISYCIFDTAMEMAQWKDEQFAEEKEEIITTFNILQKSQIDIQEANKRIMDVREILIEKACQWLKDIMYFDEYGLTHKKNTMEEFINDFKKAMKEE